MNAARPLVRAGLVVAAIAAVGLTGAAPASAVANGAAETGADHGFLARIEYGRAGLTGSTACSGALVTNRFVLTSKACLAVSGKPAKSLSVTLQAGFKLPGVEVLPHPDRNVALVRLAADLPATVVPASLATAPPAEGALLSAAGFGRTATAWVPGQPHVAPMSVTTVEPAFLRLTAEAGATTCQGDSGGPAFSFVAGKPVLAALHDSSAQLGCHGAGPAAGPSTTETRVDGLQPWLDGLLRVRNNQDIVRNLVSRMCAAIDAPTNTVGLRVEQWWCTDGRDQRWVQTALGGSTVQVRNAYSGFCLGVKTSTAANAPVSQEACSGAGQQWSLEAMDDGAVRYRNVLNKSCFANPSSSTTEGTQMITWTCNDTLRRDQHWTIQSRDQSRMLRNNVTNTCVRANTTAGFPIDTEACTDVPRQRYAFPGNASVTTIVNEATGWCLSSGGSTGNTQLVQEACDGGSDQNWLISRSTQTGQAVIRFQNQQSQLCVGVSRSGTADGTPVIQWPCGSSADHWFRA